MKTLANLTSAVLRLDDVSARQMVKDALREGTDWSALEAPARATSLEMAVAAALAEMFAERYGATPPAWTAGVQPSPEAVYLDTDASNRPRLQAYLRARSPEPFKRRNVFTYADYLNVSH